ncbi:DUF6461 domain-containing protein [Streptomyces spectabilis]|uniref:Uncharacterized protein n=1 Tax=Streptomyces spectabilis TaxID=68270 RepID=A0A5P2XMZ2_STRST|nr:DUF6461 domain-containing protein [Streptomyces spectabilis]MBB5102621.1 hypothetical protein [Streptomyces spectabilis]MCI3907660.1 DUF6461 domain-containing protein [Streptomyces spectabilis]QEV64340.1 hypothetical protein CP982_41305 [Streptomyces spectabilis]GGV30762.1 hypothetical protein GCM10010245_49770 [Streptomyces spectabilis]
MTSPEHLDGLLTELGLEEAATFTAVHGGDKDAVIRLFGGDPEQARPTELEELREHYDGDLILVSRSGPAVVVVESNGYEGSREEVLRPLSGMGRTASAFWNINLVSRLSLAEDGLVSSALDMNAPEEVYGAHPDAWQPLLMGLTLGFPDWGSGLAAVERATGARFDTPWVQGPHRAVKIEPVPDHLLPQGLADSPLLKREPFVGYLADLAPALGRMGRHALDLALAHLDLSEHPLALAALAADGLDAAARARLRDELAATHHTYLSHAHTRAEEDDAFVPAWESPSQLSFRRAAVFGVLADCVAADLPVGRLPDIVSDLATVVVGGDERVQEFRMVEHLHTAARRGLR